MRQSRTLAYNVSSENGLDHRLTYFFNLLSTVLATVFEQLGKKVQNKCIYKSKQNYRKVIILPRLQCIHMHSFDDISEVYFPYKH